MNATSMRQTIQASTVSRALPLRLIHTDKKVNVKIQFSDPVTVFFALRDSDLMSTDAAGNPLQGLKITGPVLVPIDFLGFTGEIWCACNQQEDIEVFYWEL